MVKRILFCLGTRPEIIKIWPVYLAAKNAGHEVRVFYTNQNFANCLSSLIFADFQYDPKDLIYDKRLGELDSVLASFNKVLDKFDPDCVLVEGDTWSALSGAIYAKAKRIKVGHIEAGLRSFDKQMVEEKVRIMIDNFSDYLFAPTDIAFKNLKLLKLSGKVYKTGNTIYDLLKDKKLKIGSSRDYIIVTLHRPELVDVPKNLDNVLKALETIAKTTGYQMDFFIHPRTANRIKDFGLTIDKKIKVKQPIGHSEFLTLLNCANLVITDSGGTQEESAIWNVPCITVRNNTERPETVEAKLNILVGYDPEKIIKGATDIMNIIKEKQYDTKPLYGDGHAGEKIINILQEQL
jgi:UDP-N-acetylglucosamine 2-epimerase (non-hydrolysing)